MVTEKSQDTDKKSTSFFIGQSQHCKNTFLFLKKQIQQQIILHLSFIFLWSYNSYMVHAHTRKYKLFFYFPNTNIARRIYGHHYHLYVYFFIVLLLLLYHYRSHISAPRGRRQPQIQTTLNH